MAAALCLRHFQSGKILGFCCSVHITISVPCKPLCIVTAIKTRGRGWACRTHVKEKYKQNILSEESNVMCHLEKTEPLLRGYQKAFSRNKRGCRLNSSVSRYESVAGPVNNRTNHTGSKEGRKILEQLMSYKFLTDSDTWSYFNNTEDKRVFSVKIPWWIRTDSHLQPVIAEVRCRGLKQADN